MPNSAAPTWKGIVESLYEASLDDLRRYLRNKLGNEQEAEDIAHDAYLRVYKARVGADEVRDPRGYLFATAMRLALNRLRQRQRRSRAVWPHAPELLEPGLQGAAGSLDDSMAARERLERVLETLDGLPPKCRTVFLLHRFRGLSYRQISDELGVSRKTVEYHMTKALARLMGVPE